MFRFIVRLAVRPFFAARIYPAVSAIQVKARKVYNSIGLLTCQSSGPKIKINIVSRKNPPQTISGMYLTIPENSNFKAFALFPMKNFFMRSICIYLL